MSKEISIVKNNDIVENKDHLHNIDRNGLFYSHPSPRLVSLVLFVSVYVGELLAAEM